MALVVTSIRDRTAFRAPRRHSLWLLDELSRARMPARKVRSTVVARLVLRNLSEPFFVPLQSQRREWIDSIYFTAWLVPCDFVYFFSTGFVSKAVKTNTHF